MPADATARAVRDVLEGAHGAGHAPALPEADAGAHLQSAITSDISDGASPGEVVRAIRAECPEEAIYTRLLELFVLAGLDELQVIAGLPHTDLQPRDVSVAPSASPLPRRGNRRRR